MTALYDSIGAGYDVRRRADQGIAAHLANALGPTGDGAFLDLACGSGNYTIALAGLGHDLTGLDVSSRMLVAARAKSSQVNWVLGAVESLPFRDRTFQGALCTLAIHHFDGLAAAFRECHRVLRSRGVFALFTGEAGQMRNYWLNAYFPMAMARSIARMPERADIERCLRGAGFREISFTPYWVGGDLRDHFLYSGKNNPDFYFHAEVRAAISTFAQHGDEREIRDGVARLRADLANGHFETVRRCHGSGLGDYIFVSAIAS